MLKIFLPLINFLIGGVTIKFVLFLAITLAFSLLFPLVTELLLDAVNTADISSGYSQLSTGAKYYGELFALDFGIPLVFSAYVTRFIIRRLPVVG